MASLELMRHTLPSAETTSNHASFMSSDFRQDGNLQSSRSAGAGSLQDVSSSPVSRATCTKRDVAHATMSTEAASSGFIGALGEGRRAGRVVARHTHGTIHVGTSAARLKCAEFKVMKISSRRPY